jgi:hypothetical protein
MIFLIVPVMASFSSFLSQLCETLAADWARSVLDNS